LIALTLFGALVFGAIVYASIIACERVAPVGERGGTLAAEALRVFLCATAAIVGATLVAHAAPPQTLFALALFCAALGATCFLTTLDVGVPAVVPGTALAILIGAALVDGDFGPLLSALATGSPFALTAIVARKSGSDWRDALVAALGGAAFGLQLGLFVVGFACLTVALARPYLARHRTSPQPPARFSSALAGFFMVFLLGKLAIS
jgi:hypothetical protein